MKLFVTGGTGVLGRPAVRGLVAAGHEVRASARSAGAAQRLQAAGATPVDVDVFDRDGIARAVEGADAVCHLATSIPPASRMARRSAWRTNDRLRTETTRSLADAGRRSGCAALIAQSITFILPDGGDRWLDETTPPAGDRGWFGSAYDLEAEVARVTADGGRGVVLRFGLFYGPEARATDEYLRLARLGVAPILGRPDAFVSSIHVDDAATAVVASIEAPAGLYHVVDDEPVPRRDYASAFSAAFGLRRLRAVPPWLARAAGRGGARALLRSHRVTNRRFHETTGWVPAHPSVGSGWRAVAEARGPGAGAGS